MPNSEHLNLAMFRDRSLLGTIMNAETNFVSDKFITIYYPLMFKPGDLLDDRYLITGDLGQGGMAYVFRAKDQHLDREVALKVLRPHLTETDQERFRREIRTLARLSHPGIVTIYDLGRGEHVQRQVGPGQQRGREDRVVGDIEVITDG